MYVTKSGAVQKISEDTLPYWQGLGWSVDQNRDGIADSSQAVLPDVVPPGDPYRFDVTRLSAYRAAVANAANMGVNWLPLGDSYVEGDTVTAAQRWVNQFTALQRSRYGIAAGGEGYIPMLYIGSSLTDRFTFTGTTSTPASKAGLGAQRWRQVNAGGTAQAFAFTGTDLIVWITEGSGVGSYTWAIDGGSATTVSGTAAATATGIAKAINGLAPGAHTLVLTALSGNSFFEGVSVFNGDFTTGLRQYEGGYSGARTVDLLEAGTNAMYGSYRNVKPKLVVINLGLNDWGIGSAVTSRISPRVFRDNLTDLIAAVRSGQDDPSIILAEPPLRGLYPQGGLSGTWPEFVSAIRRVARADGRITLWDQAAVLGDLSQGGAGNALVQSDKVHPTALGHAALAASLDALVAAA